jgi:hypothetical protein
VILFLFTLWIILGLQFICGGLRFVEMSRA